ncbi:MAG: hypothetical protein KY476_26225 [Planctomycetes bacterium]|nr:hypothetical protein [Planctomycetota bacterium]
MKPLEIRKQISIFISLSDWKAIRAEAARQKIPMTELCRRWMRPEMSRLLRRNEAADGRNGDD